MRQDLKQEVQKLNQYVILRGISDMLAYELYTFNKKKGYEFIGVLPERRKNPTRITKVSITNWGKTLFG
jgi:hypothetical protein